MRRPRLMRAQLSVLALILTLLSVARAHAEEPSQPAAPKPNTCSEASERVRRCYYAGGATHHTLRMAPNGAVVLEFDAPLTIVAIPQAHFRPIQSPGEPHILLLQALRADWPPTMLQVKTREVTATFDIVKTPAASSDAQIHMVRVDASQRDAAVEERVSKAKADLEERYQRRFAGLDEKAAALARRSMVDWALQDLALDDTRGTERSRGDHILTVAERRVRLGHERIVEFRIENRDWSVLPLARPRFFLERGGRVEPLGDAVVRCEEKVLRPNARTRCVVLLGLTHALRDDDRLRIVVREKAGDRRAVHGGIDVR